MKEATENRFTIKDVSNSAFRTLITWLYTGKVFLNPGTEPALHFEPDLQQKQGRKDDTFLDTSSDTDYDAVSETSKDRNYEYSEGSEHEEISPTRTVFPGPFPRLSLTGGRPAQASTVERSPSQQVEEEFVHRLFGETDPKDLDSYQMETLSHIFEDDDEAAPSIAKWRSRLEAEKKEAEDSAKVTDETKDSNVDNFDRLLDLYIIADRFDVSLLRKDTLNLLDAEKAETHTILTEQALPSYAFVIKAYENLPMGSELLLWLIDAFAHRWSPAGDTPEDRETRDELPRDFLFDLACALAERNLVSE